MSTASKCPDENDIVAYLGGTQAAPDLERVEAHLEECSSCRSVLALSAGPAAPGLERLTLPDPGLEASSETASVGRYQLRGLIGEGGMGRVFEAYDPELRRRVALKVLHPGQQTDTQRALLLREARALALLRHPNIVSVFDAGVEDDTVFIAMELIEGLDMRGWLKTEPTEAAILGVFAQALAALEAAHASGVVHRDFKPDNVLVDDDSRVTVTDFGLASLRGSVAGRASSGKVDEPLHESLTLADGDALVGTPAYMAPELHRGDAATPRSDQFAFFVSFVEAMSGSRPFAGTGRDALREAMQRPLEREALAAIPRSMRAIVRRGLAKDPDDRHASLASIAPLFRPSRRRSWIALGALTMAAALVVILALPTATLLESASPQASPVHDFDTELARGLDRLLGGEVTLAVEPLETAARLRPSDRRANFWLAIAYWWNSRDRTEVVAQVEHALALELSEHQRQFLLGLQLHVDRQYPEALHHFESLVAAHPTPDKFVLYGLFETQFHGGYPTRAVETYRRIRRMDPSFRLGVLHVLDHFALRRDREGLTWALDALDTSAGGDPAWVVTAHMALREWDEADRELAALRRRGRTTPSVERRVAGLEEHLAFSRLRESAGPLPEPLGERGRWGLALATGDAVAAARHRAAAYDSLTVRSTVRNASDSIALDAVACEVDACREASARLLRNAGSIRSRRLEVGLGLLGVAAGDEAAISRAASSPYPDSRAIATAWRAQSDGDHVAAAAAWREVRAANASHSFQLVILWRLAQAEFAAGNRAKVVSICEEVRAPAAFSWSWGAAVVPCLELGLRAAIAVGDRAAASVFYETMLRLRGPDDRAVKAAAAMLDR